MPKRSKKKDMWKHGSSTSKKSKKSNGNAANESSAAAMFQEIADEEDEEMIGMEGIFTLGEKLGIDATEDIRILVLLWKMGCSEKPNCVSKSEWLAGCSKLQVDSWAKLQTQVPALDVGFLEHSEFREFYKFCFQFNRSGTYKTLDKELVVALLDMVLKTRIEKTRLKTFCDFLEQSPSYSRITLDQWTSFYDFCHECEDLATFDESTSAWPVLIDEYVEFMEAQTKK